MEIKYEPLRPLPTVYEIWSDGDAVNTFVYDNRLFGIILNSQKNSGPLDCYDFEAATIMKLPRNTIVQRVDVEINVRRKV